MGEGKTLIFFHIAKTAGFTLDMIIRRQFPQDSIYSINPGANLNSVDEFKSLPTERGAKTRYLHAHLVPFGIHELLPQPPIYITLLRNPVERVISRYFHVLRDPNNPLHHAAKNLSLQDFVTSGVLSADGQNGQTRVISGVRGIDWVTASGPLSHDILEIAKTNLREHFLLIGISERFDESLILLKRALGWRTKDILYVKQNVGRNRPPIDEIDNDTLKLIERYNELDIELYAWAKQIFEEQICQQDSSFRSELQTFRVCNKIYGRIMNSKLHTEVILLRAGIAKVKAAARKYR